MLFLQKLFSAKRQSLNLKQVTGVVCLFLSDNKFPLSRGRKYLKLLTDCGILSIRKAPTPRVDASRSGKMLY